MSFLSPALYCFILCHNTRWRIRVQFKLWMRKDIETRPWAGHSEVHAKPTRPIAVIHVSNSFNFRRHGKHPSSEGCRNGFQLSTLSRLGCRQSKVLFPDTRHKLRRKWRYPIVSSVRASSDHLGFVQRAPNWNTVFWVCHKPCVTKAYTIHRVKEVALPAGLNR